MRKIYVASSWRNEEHKYLVDELRLAGHEVYDFKNPPNYTGFSWDQVGGTAFSKVYGITKEEPFYTYLKMINHPKAQAGFDSDFNAMKWADTFVLHLPCGKSAHLELGWAVGQGKKTCILTDGYVEPELMYKMVDLITDYLPELTNWLGEL